MEIYYIACFIAATISEIETENIGSKITEYFNSDIVHSFQSTWKKYKKPLENAVLRAIKENYGSKAMNVYVRRLNDPYKISKGYCHTDNQVQIALSDLELDDLPYLWMPEVNILLPSNIIQIGATLSKMIIRSNYVVFRNRSQLIYDVKDQNIYESSPFRYQQVQTIGQLGISIEGCIITGKALMALVGSSVSLRFSSFKLSKCQYTFEIYTPGSGSPPVIARYHPLAAGLNIENLVMRSLSGELMPKLQAAMFSYVNTSAILNDKLYVLRQKQEELFRQTTQYMSDVVRSLNKITMENNAGVVEMEDYKLAWNDPFDDKAVDSEIYFSKMILNGLETAYSSHIGGSFMQPNPYICEEIRFSTLRVHGNIAFKGASKREYRFIAEIQDMSIEVYIDVNLLKSRKQLVKLNPTQNYRFHVTGWRGLEFSVPKSNFIYTDALLTGFLLNKIPKYIIKHLEENFNQAQSQAGHEATVNYSNNKYTQEDRVENINKNSDAEVASKSEFHVALGGPPPLSPVHDDLPARPSSGEQGIIDDSSITKRPLAKNVTYYLGESKEENQAYIPGDELQSDLERPNFPPTDSPGNPSMVLASDVEISDK